MPIGRKADLQTLRIRKNTDADTPRICQCFWFHSAGRLTNGSRNKSHKVVASVRGKDPKGARVSAETEDVSQKTAVTTEHD